ncbi:MAG: hypothetical protein HYV29_15465 [Ignavibacteriales bacterium]|nr:hypothetical protein [Ignavibacteriales bacterium]
MVRFLSAIFFSLLIPAAVIVPDIVYLKTGYIVLNAEVIEMNEEYVHIKTDRVRSIPVNNIAKILFRPLIHIVPSSIISVDDTLTLSNYFSSVELLGDNPAESQDSIVTVFLRNNSTVRGTISLSGNTLSVMQEGPTTSVFDADEIQRVINSRGNAVIFGSEENRFITISNGEFSFIEINPLDRLLPFDNSLSLGVGIGSSFENSQYVLSMYPAPVMIDNFTTRYSGSIFYEHRASQRIYLSLCGEYSRTRFETSDAVLFLEIMAFRGGVKLYLPGTDAVMPFVLINYGYAFAFLPIYSTQHVSERSEGATFSTGLGVLLSQRFSLSATYGSYRLTTSRSNSGENSLRSFMFTLYFHINQSDAYL